MDEQSLPLDLRSLKALSVLGRGAKGVAFLVQTDSSSSPPSFGETLALKAISKTSIEHRKNRFDEDDADVYRRIWFERDVLSSLHHPLLPNLRGFVVTDKIVGFAMQYCSGGNLNSLRKKQSEKMFSDDIIRFYAAELVLVLEYLHGRGIVYRDLKPENVLIQENGHLMLVDFDLSKKLSVKSSQPPQIRPPKPVNLQKPTMAAKKKRLRSILLCRAGVSRVNSVSRPQFRCNWAHSVDSADSALGKSNSFVGTEDYVAPEVILGNGHDFAVDWWGLGVVLYEMLYGKTPFRSCSRKETFNRIVMQQPDLVGEKTDLRDLIGKLLEKDPKKRISREGIKAHEFFKKVDWEKVLEISRPPFIPAGGLAGEGGMDGQDAGIDMEGYVENVFRCNVGNGRSKSCNEKGAWVEGLNNNNNHHHHHSNVDDANFSMF